MKFCSKCGKEVLDEAVSCPNCGCSIAVNHEADVPKRRFAVLSFFFPIVGLILYLIWKDKTPLKAKSAGKWALIGFIIGSVLWIVCQIVLQIVSDLAIGILTEALY